MMGRSNLFSMKECKVCGKEFKVDNGFAKGHVCSFVCGLIYAKQTGNTSSAFEIDLNTHKRYELFLDENNEIIRKELIE